MTDVAGRSLPGEDLAHVLEHARRDFEGLRGARLFVTGGTGFFGKWLVETFLHANRELGLGAAMTVLSRNPERFSAECPHLARDASLSLQTGDVRRFEFSGERYSHVIHGATAASAKPETVQPLEMFDTIVEGTRRVLEFAARAGVRRLLFLSSGAVYGPQPSGMTHIPETWPGGPDPLQPGSAYGEGKRAAEFLCCASAKARGFDVVIARCFALVGPHLPLYAHFAIGNFIADALAGRAISIRGDGTPYRSYLHTADLAMWLWAILNRGENGRAYNVGSDQGMTIREIATAVEEVAGTTSGVVVAKPPTPGAAPARYVPSTERAHAELGLEQRIGLGEGVARTIRWARETGRVSSLGLNLPMER
jgi:dTDP-glucose 4,6-dehydratase